MALLTGFVLSERRGVLRNESRLHSSLSFSASTLAGLTELPRVA